MLDTGVASRSLLEPFGIDVDTRWGHDEESPEVSERPVHFGNVTSEPSRPFVEIALDGQDQRVAVLDVAYPLTRIGGTVKHPEDDVARNGVFVQQFLGPSEVQSELLLAHVKYDARSQQKRSAEASDARRPARRSTLFVLTREGRTMPQVQLSEETVKRLDSLQQEDESYDELIQELINIYEAEELTLFHTGDEA